MPPRSSIPTRFLPWLAVVLSLVPAAVSVATPSTSGEVIIAFTSPPKSVGLWKFDIRAVSFIPFTEGEFQFRVTRDTIGSPRLRDEILWKGGMERWDSLHLTHEMEALPLGGYLISATLVPFPGRVDGNRATRTEIYLHISENGVFWSHGSVSAAKYEEILWELEQRGLGGISREEMDSLAPDLAHRIRELSISRATPRTDSLSHELRRQWGIPPRDTLPKRREIGARKEERIIQLPDRPMRVKPAPEPRPKGPTWKEPYTVEGGPPPLPERPPTLSGPTRRPGDSDYARSADAEEKRAAWREMQKRDSTLPDLVEPVPPRR